MRVDVHSRLGSGRGGRRRRTLPARRARHLRLFRELLLAGAGSRSFEQCARLDCQLRLRDERLEESRSGVPMKPGLLLAFAAASLFCRAGTLYLPAYPASVLVFSEEKAQIIDRIPLATGTPMSIRLAPDHKKIYVTTIDHNGIEVIDVATRKVINHFELNTPTKQYRFRGGAADPEGKYFYTVTREIDKLPEHFEVKPGKYTVIDLQQQKIVKTVDMPLEDERTNRLSYEVSPDGKYLYQFGPKIKILQTSDFKVVDTLDLAAPDFDGMENIRLGGDLDSISQPGMHTSLFNSADPIVHNRVFGLARWNLATREVSYSLIGPS